MPLATVATGIGMQVVTHAASIWLGARRERAGRDAELIDLVRISVRDHFQQRKLVRQLEDLADQIAERLRPVYEHEFRDMAENERAAALLAVVDALKAADLTDDTLFAVDVDARKLAQLVRQRVPVRRVGLAEPAERLYDVVLDADGPPSASTAAGYAHRGGSGPPGQSPATLTQNRTPVTVIAEASGDRLSNPRWRRPAR
ncbi:MAG: hypothetical protein WCF33_06895 [Pseudonocardiaceae bacterium]